MEDGVSARSLVEDRPAERFWVRVVRPVGTLDSELLIILLVYDQTRRAPQPHDIECPQVALELLEPRSRPLWGFIGTQLPQPVGLNRPVRRLSKLPPGHILMLGFPDAGEHSPVHVVELFLAILD